MTNYEAVGKNLNFVIFKSWVFFFRENFIFFLKKILYKDKKFKINTQ